MTLSRLKNLACVLLLLSITGCINQYRNNSPGQAATGAPESPPVSATGPACRIGPNGGPPPDTVPPAPRHPRATADRGIGGTGAPTIAGVTGVDRIAGATGVHTISASTATSGNVTADRGIGGTGIVGVITGFASICVDGLEVAYDRAAPVDIDGTRIDSSWLRVGQVVAIEATETASAAPVARAISVRVEVTGRIERIELASGLLRIGGQPVLVNAGIPGADRFTLGDWVAVSGLRRTDGTIVASRLDATPAGRLTARGQVTQQDGGLRLGALPLPAGSARPGDWVRASGLYTGGQPKVLSVAADTVCPDPAHCFPGAVGHVIVQAFVRAEAGHLRIDGMQMPVVVPNGTVPADGFAIISLDRQPDGSFTAVGLKYVDPAHISGATQLSPAEPLMIALSNPHLPVPPPAPVIVHGSVPPEPIVATVNAPVLSAPSPQQNPATQPQAPPVTTPVTTPIGPLIQLPGSPLPVLSPGSSEGVPISQANPPFGAGSPSAVPRNTFTPAGVASAGHAGSAAGTAMQSLGARASTPSIVAVTPGIPATAAGVMLNTGATIATPVVSSPGAASAAKK
jgi:hypothetical protein